MFSARHGRRPISKISGESFHGLKAVPWRPQAALSGTSELPLADFLRRSQAFEPDIARRRTELIPFRGSNE